MSTTSTVIRQTTTAMAIGITTVGHIRDLTTQVVGTAGMDNTLQHLQ
jgi:hypothetical protein